jgi:hypothetical protein
MRGRERHTLTSLSVLQYTIIISGGEANQTPCGLAFGRSTLFGTSAVAIGAFWSSCLNSLERETRGPQGRQGAAAADESIRNPTILTL